MNSKIFTLPFLVLKKGFQLDIVSNNYGLCAKKYCGAGIKPDGESYDLDSIRLAIKEATGFTPDIECNTDASKNRQVYQVFMCADISGSEFIECPVPLKKRCKSNKVHFPEFWITTVILLENNILRY